MSKLALFGATGAVGRSVADALSRDGTPFRAVARSRSSLERAFANDPGAELVVWNPDSAEDIRRAATGVDTILLLAGGDYHRWQDLLALTRRVVEGAVAAGARRIVLAGTVYVYGRPQTATVTEDHPRVPDSVKGRIRIAQEDLLLEAHAAGRIEATILRLPSFYGPGVDKSLLHGMFRAACRGSVAPMVAPLDVPGELVFVPDIGPVLVGLARAPGAAGRAFNLGGAGVITQRELATLAFATTRHRLRTLPVGRRMLWLGGLVDPVMRELVEMHYLQTTPLVVDDRALHALLGEVGKTSYADGVRRSVEAMQRAESTPRTEAA